MPIHRSILELDSFADDPALLLSNLKKKAMAVEYTDENGKVHQVGHCSRFHLRRIGGVIRLACHAELEDEGYAVLQDGGLPMHVGTRPVLGEAT